jgi:hypothetical protein
MIGGLQIADSALTFVGRADGEQPVSLRLPPGVLEEGKVIDRDRFRELLGQFRSMVDSENRTQPIPVIVALPAAAVFTQSFSVPNIGGTQLDESVALNLQMISPLPHESAYMGAQRVSENAERCEFLGAFAEKKYVDGVKELLEGAHFQAVAFEFPGLALSRLVGTLAHADAASMLVFYLSSDGLNLLLYRNGSLYFDYFRSWHSIQGDSREISRSVFDEVVAQETQKVINFALSRFQETPEQVLLIAPGFEQELQSFIRDRFGLPVTIPDFKNASLEPAWYVALGSALRGAIDRSADEALTLAPVSSSELFYQEQLIGFISLWRNITGAVLLLFLILFVGTTSLLSNQAKLLDHQLSFFTDERQKQKLAALEESAEEFNALVSTIAEVRGSGSRPSLFFDRLNQLVAHDKVTVLSFGVSKFDTAIQLTARAPDYDSVLKFKQTLLGEKDFKNVELPLSRISTSEDNTVVFTISFLFTPSAAP